MGEKLSRVSFLFFSRVHLHRSVIMNFTKLEIAAGRSNIIFKELQKKHPDLSGYLVLSSPYGQCKITTDGTAILNSFPQMIADGKQKEKAMHLLQKISETEAENKKLGGKPKSLDKLNLQMTEVLEDLEIRDDTFVEIRFNSDLDLIFKLQTDELVSQEHTPQTKASIRIVLGTIGELSKISSDEEINAATR